MKEDFTTTAMLFALRFICEGVTMRRDHAGLVRFLVPPGTPQHVRDRMDATLQRLAALAPADTAHVALYVRSSKPECRHLTPYRLGLVMTEANRRRWQAERNREVCDLPWWLFMRCDGLDTGECWGWGELRSECSHMLDAAHCPHEGARFRVLVRADELFAWFESSEDLAPWGALCGH